MGYYSDVAITLYKEDFEILIERATKEMPDCIEFIRRSIIQEAHDGNVITILWSSVKWYRQNELVNYITSFLENDGRQFQFRRIGEEVGDIEQTCYDPEWVLCDATHIECYIDNTDAGEIVDTDDIIDSVISMSNKKDEDNIKEVSEEELLDIIGA